jgi:hypothetical protein
VSDEPDDQDGTAEEVTEQPLGAWSEPAQGSAWANIEDQAESAAPGPVGPGAPPEEPPTVVDPVTEAGRSRRPTSLRDQYVKSDDPPVPPAPRRKLDSPAFPSAPAIPGSQAVPASPADPSVSEPGPGPEPEPEPEPTSGPGAAGDPSPAPNPAPSLKEKLPLDKLPLDQLSLKKLPLDKLSLKKLPLDKLPLGKLPFKKPPRDKPSRDKPATEKLSTDKLPVDKIRTLARQRPELGVGLAFAGGLVIATILKRLGRR